MILLPVCRRISGELVLETLRRQRTDPHYPRTETELFSQSLSKAVSLSYTAGTGDFDSVNNFAKDDRDRNSNSNLEQSRLAIEAAKTSLDRILGMV